MSTLKCLHEGQRTRPVLVFVHGLEGHPIDTWRHKRCPADNFWLHWIGADTTCDVWTLGYDAALSLWTGNAMPLPYQASNLLDQLASDEDLKNRELVLIGHSMGGLVITTAIVDGNTTGDSRHQALVKQIKGIVFIATPHSGADLANLAMACKRLLRTNKNVGDLTRHNPALNTLSRQFRTTAKTLGIACRVFCEGHCVRVPRFPWARCITKEVMVVERSSADPVVLGASVVPLPEDHFSICKPADREQQLYKSLVDFVKNCLPQAPVLPFKPDVDPTPAADPTPDAAHSSTSPYDISAIDRYASNELFGREAEKAILDADWQKALRGEQERPHVRCFFAFGGQGKTALVARWAVDFAQKGWPDCHASFAWSFYRQGTSEQSEGSDPFLKKALGYFGDPEMAESACDPEVKGRRLAELVGQQRTLLILDGLEPLQHPPGEQNLASIKDPGIGELLRKLTSRSLGLCLVTSRYEIADLLPYKDNAPQMELKKLSTPDGVKLLKYHLKFTDQDKEREYTELENNALEKLVVDMHGHALTLTLIGTYLRDAHHGDIWRRDCITLSEADRKSDNWTEGHAFRVIEAHEKWLADSDDDGKRALALLRLLGLFDRPASEDCLAALLNEPPIAGLTEALMGLPEAQRDLALSRLEGARLLAQELNSARRLVSIDAHPLVREYFAEQLSEQHTQAWRQAHARLFDHLRETTPDVKEPKLEDLQPLYQAVRHGCLAGRLQDAYEVLYKRIQRGRDKYSLSKLGLFSSDLGAITGFFEHPSNPPYLTVFSHGLRLEDELTDPAKSHLWLRAGFCLRALGRLDDARQPTSDGLELAVNIPDWLEAGIGAGALSQLELTQGNIDAALECGARAVTYADNISVGQSEEEKSKTKKEQLAKRTIYAEALHQAGHLEEARDQFADAENLQAERAELQPKKEPQRLHSLWGFRYCQLLLVPAERAAWRAFLTSGGLPNPKEFAPTPETDAAIKEVKRRATEWTEHRDRERSKLDQALERLAGGYALLLEAVLSGSSSLLESCGEPLTQAVDGLRQAGQQDHLPRGLLPRACWHFLSKRYREAQADLDEAWGIALRGPMSLFKADILLTRARLFGTLATLYPWPPSPAADLADARRLIDTYSYNRRRGELEDLGSEQWAVAPETTERAGKEHGHTVMVANQEIIYLPPGQPIRLPVIVLLTVNKTETDAILDVFLGTGAHPEQRTEGGITYNLLGTHGGLNIVHTVSEMGAGGVGASQQRTREAIRDWSPRAIIAVGIAFGADESKQKIGDVLVSRQIQDYDLGRINADGSITPRGDKPSCADVLRNRLRQTDLAKGRLAPAIWPRVEFGLVLSGQKLVDNIDYRNSLRGLYPEAIGGEMEGTGVYVSAIEKNVDWILIKGICDWGHGKAHADKDAWQRKAATNAAIVLKASLGLNGLY